MPLDSRKVAHIEANRAKIREGRTETVVLVSGTGPVTYQAITDASGRTSAKYRRALPIAPVQSPANRGTPSWCYPATPVSRRV